MMTFQYCLLSLVFLLNFFYSYDATFKSDLLMGYLEYPVKDNRHINQTRIYKEASNELYVQVALKWPISFYLQ